MDTLVKFDLTSPASVKIKKELTSNFVNNFTKVELSITENNRVKKNVVPSTDVLNIAGYFITLRDVITLLADLSDGLPLTDSLSLKSALKGMLANPNHPINKPSREKAGLGIEFGYGFSRPRTEGSVLIASTKELQLMVSSVTNFVENKNNGLVKSIYTTAKIATVLGEITPPTGGTKYPNTSSETD